MFRLTHDLFNHFAAFVALDLNLSRTKTKLLKDMSTQCWIKLNFTYEYVLTTNKAVIPIFLQP